MSHFPLLSEESPPPAALATIPSTSLPVPEMYGRLADALRIADAAIVSRDVPAKLSGLDVATAVVFDLFAALDFEGGGELAPRLAALYSYFASEILYVSRSEDRQQIRGLLDMIGVLTGTWHDGGVKMRC